jgi:hypothetical protein
MFVRACDGTSGAQEEVAYSNYKVVGNGSFGVVFQVGLYLPALSRFELRIPHLCFTDALPTHRRNFLRRLG